MLIYILGCAGQTTVSTKNFYASSSVNFDGRTARPADRWPKSRRTEYCKTVEVGCLTGSRNISR